MSGAGLVAQPSRALPGSILDSACVRVEGNVLEHVAEGMPKGLRQAEADWLSKNTHLGIGLHRLLLQVAHKGVAV